MAQIGGAALGALALTAYAWSHNVLLLWWSGSVLLSAVAIAMVVRPCIAEAPPRESPGNERALWLVAVACSALTLVCHRYAVDDSFYVSVAAGVADKPSLPLLSWDPLLGTPGLPLHNPIHRIHSYELLNGALAYLTGIPAIRCFHWISAGFAGLLVPLCYARLFRILLPAAWLPALIGAVVYLVANGDTHFSYGNYAFVRIWHGKAILIHALLPLIYAYALQYAAKPTVRHWALLCAAQIAAVGASSSALWLAPFSAGLALLPCAPTTRRGFAIVAVGALASLYPLAVGWAIKSEMVAAVWYQIQPAEVGHELQKALAMVLGRRDFEMVGLASIVLTWSCLPVGAARRFAVFVPLGAWLLVLNPYWESTTQLHLTGASFWRTMWAMPVPALMGLLAAAPFAWAPRGRWRFAAGVAVVASLTALFFAVPMRTTIRSGSGFANRVSIGMPRLKVDDQAYGYAAALSKSVPTGSTVIAPVRVSRWIPTFHHHPNPLLARPMYLKRQVPKEEYRRRMEITEFVEGKRRGADAVALFRDGLEAYHVAAVCLLGLGDNGARRVLQEEGFHIRDFGGAYEIWTRRLR